MGIKVPRGRKVVIRAGGENVTPDTNLVLEEDLTLNITSNFQPLVDAGGNRALTFLGSLSSAFTGVGFSGQFKSGGFQQWTGTEPLNTSFNVGLYMKTDALVDVIRPAKRLMRLVVPLESSLRGEGARGVGLIAPGPTILEVLSDATPDKDPHPGRNLSMVIGNTVHFKKMIIKAVEPTFSTETDTNDYPIWCKLKIDVATVYTATVQMVDDYIGIDTSGNSSGGGGGGGGFNL